MAEIYNSNFPIDETICKDCVFRMSKLITPVDLESFGLNEEDLEDIDIEDGEDLLIEQHTCLISHSDMDYIVKSCNHFKSTTNDSFFINNPYE